MKLGITILAVVAFMAVDTVNAANLENLKSSERDAFREEVRAYLLENPEVILEALEALEGRKATADAETAKERIEAASEVIFSDAHSWVGGNPDGDVALVEFLDYRCGFCRRAYGDVEALVAGDGNIRFIVKEFPILGEESLNSAFFALSLLYIEGADAYKAAHDFLISYDGLVNDDFVRKFASSHGFNAAAIIDEMSGDRVREAVTANYELASFLGVEGTPGFIVGDQLFRGWIGQEGLRSAVDQTRSQVR